MRPHPLKEEGKTGDVTQRRRRQWDRDPGDVATRGWMKQKTRSLLEPWEGAQLSSHLDFSSGKLIADFWPPALGSVPIVGRIWS